MVRIFECVRLGFIVTIFVSLPEASALPNNSNKSLSEKQADSFIVSANYGIESGSINNQTTNQYLGSSESYLPYIYEHESSESQASTNVTNQDQFDGSMTFSEALQPETHTYDAPSKSIENEKFENMPTPSAWKGSHTQNFEAYRGHLQKDPPIYVTNAYQSYDTNQNINENSVSSEMSKSSGLEYQYKPISSPASTTQWYSTNFIQPQARADGIHDVLEDTHKPTVNDLQQIISKVVKGVTKVHQVVKVPAVYEIHLQEEDKSGEQYGNVVENSNHFQLQLPMWSNEPSIAHQGSADSWKQNFPNKWQTIGNKFTPKTFGWKQQRPWKSPQYPRGNRYTTKTWNLPSKINYFSNKVTEVAEPMKGKYLYPNPFTKSKWGVSSAIPLNTWTYPKHYTVLQSAPLYHGSVSIPMTPGSTAVTFLEHRNQNSYNGFNQAGTPDLSLYYAKKNQIESVNFHSSKSSHGYRRNDKVEDTREKMQTRSQRQSLYPPFAGMNYIIHVREKPRRLS